MILQDMVLLKMCSVLVTLQVIKLAEEAHLNTSFKHFIFFVKNFDLVDKRELAPLQELIDKLTKVKLQQAGDEKTPA